MNIRFDRLLDAAGLVIDLAVRGHLGVPAYIREKMSDFIQQPQRHHSSLGSFRVTSLYQVILHVVMSHCPIYSCS